MHNGEKGSGPWSLHVCAAARSLPGGAGGHMHGLVFWAGPARRSRARQPRPQVSPHPKVHALALLNGRPAGQRLQAASTACGERVRPAACRLLPPAAVPAAGWAVRSLERRRLHVDALVLPSHSKASLRAWRGPAPCGNPSSRGPCTGPITWGGGPRLPGGALGPKAFDRCQLQGGREDAQGRASRY